MTLRIPELCKQVLNEDLDEDTLKNVLVECMRDAPGDAADKEKKAGFLARIFNRRSNVEASPEDIALAAHYIIDRFGAKPTLEELQEEEATRRAGEGAPQVRRLGMCVCTRVCGSWCRVYMYECWCVSLNLGLRQGVHGCILLVVCSWKGTANELAVLAREG